MAASNNIARHLPLMAAQQPDRPAIKIPRGRTADGRIDYRTLSFRELDTEVDAWVVRLQAKGIKTGDRTLVMVRQGLPLIAAAFALFKLGAVPVIIDPGMGRKNFLACVARSKPRALLGIPLAQILSHVFRSAFKSVEIRVWTSGLATARLSSASQPSTLNSQPVSCAATDLAAILFTSGSTGAPKGVCYEHGMFEAQVRLIRATYDIQPGEVDLPMLPIFALFNPALGMTTIVPEIDPSRPAAVDPTKIVQAIRQEAVTNSFGSPTLWGKISRHCLDNKIALPSLRRVLSAGAPVPKALWENTTAWMPNGTLHSPYGATEAMPISSVSAAEIDSASTRGACVGQPAPEISVKVIAITDRPIASIADVHELPRREIGEIIVSGPVVTKEYDQLPEATSLAKIQTPNHKRQSSQPKESSPAGVWPLESGVSAPAGAVWHRMGDCGYFDDDGRLWFSGRKAERVETATGTLFTEPCEQVFRAHPAIARCALIGLGARGQQQPALVVQPAKSGTDQAAFARELRALARQHFHTSGIAHFFFHSDFPVDVRHNAKIHRLTLARWAETQKPEVVE